MVKPEKGRKHPWDWRPQSGDEIHKLPILQAWDGQGDRGVTLGTEKGNETTIAVFEKDSVLGWRIINLESGWYRLAIYKDIAGPDGYGASEVRE